MIQIGKNKAFNFSLPRLPKLLQFFTTWRCIIWKINVKKILSKDCSIKFIVNQETDSESIRNVHILKFQDLSKLEGLGWIEYSFKISKIPEINTGKWWLQPSIEVNGFINMQIDYIRFMYDNYRKEIYFPKMGHLLPIHKIRPNVPEAFKD
ncbi:hypothetical protein RhiirC2_802690, partial [Rhizophagus irregularis]